MRPSVASGGRGRSGSSPAGEDRRDEHGEVGPPRRSGSLYTRGRSIAQRLAEGALGAGGHTVPWLVVGTALVYLVFLVARFGHLLSAVHWSSDAAFWQVLVQDLPRRAPGGVANTDFTNLGDTPHYITILFLLATRGLPAHQTIWDIAPVVSSVAGVGLIAWASRHAFGRRGGYLTLCIGVSASLPVLQTIIPHGVRNWTWLADAVVGALLVLLVRTVGGHHRSLARILTGTVAGVAATVLAGVTLASDPLFMAAGLGPFVLAVGVVVLRHPGRASARLAVSAAAVVAMSLVLSAIVTGAMRDLGFRSTYPSQPFVFAGYEQILRNAGFVGEAFLGLGNGLFFGRRLDLASATMVLSGLAGLAAIVTALPRSTRMLVRPDPGAERDPVLTGFLAYWAFSAVLVVAGFVLSTIPVGGLASARYLIPVFYAVAALIPLCGMGSRTARMVVGAAAAVFCVAGIFSQDVLVRFDGGTEARSRDGPKVIEYLEKERLSRGYAGYWDSHALTWHSSGRTKVYPVYECAPGKTLCPFWLAVSTAWYKPVPGTRTFILARPTGIPPVLTSPPPEAFGHPVETAVVGDYSIFVYDYDVTTRFGPMPGS